LTSIIPISMLENICLLDQHWLGTLVHSEVI
jgi:hypothetical protein